MQVCPSCSIALKGDSDVIEDGFHICKNCGLVLTCSVYSELEEPLTPINLPVSRNIPYLSPQGYDERRFIASILSDLNMMAYFERALFIFDCLMVGCKFGKIGKANAIVAVYMSCVEDQKPFFLKDFQKYSETPASTLKKYYLRGKRLLSIKQDLDPFSIIDRCINEFKGKLKSKSFNRELCCSLFLFCEEKSTEIPCHNLALGIFFLIAILNADLKPSECYDASPSFGLSIEKLRLCLRMLKKFLISLNQKLPWVEDNQNFLTIQIIKDILKYAKYLDIENEKIERPQKKTKTYRDKVKVAFEKRNLSKPLDAWESGILKAISLGCRLEDVCSMSFSGVLSWLSGVDAKENDVSEYLRSPEEVRVITDLD